MKRHYRSYSSIIPRTRPSSAPYYLNNAALASSLLSAANQSALAVSKLDIFNLLHLLKPLNSLKEKNKERKEKKMAADTRDRDSSSQPYSPAQASQDPNRKTYERFGNSPPSNCASNNSGTAVEVAPPQNANLLPGGTMNTAGGKVRESSILEAAKTIKLGDFRELHKKPCARESFLVGIGAGFGVGGLRAVMGGLFFLPIFSFFF